MESGSRCFLYSPPRCVLRSTGRGKACHRNDGSKAACQGPHWVSPGATILGSLPDQCLPVTPVTQRSNSRAVMMTANHKPEVKPKDKKKIHPLGKSRDIRAMRPGVKTIASLHAACGFSMHFYTSDPGFWSHLSHCQVPLIVMPQIPNQGRAGST